MGAWRAFRTWYVGPWQFERFGQGRIYEILGVRLYKRFLRTSANPAARLEGTGGQRLGSRRARLQWRLQRHLEFTCKYEVLHLFGAVATQLGLGAIIWAPDKRSVTFLAVITILVHIYPAFLQRYNRVRVLAALSRITRSG